jgi:hypothetical protein
VGRDITQWQYSATVHILISKSIDLMFSHHPPSAVVPNEKKSIANYGILTQKKCSDHSQAATKFRFDVQQTNKIVGFESYFYHSSV